jgi:hypothetical protein
MNKVHSNEEGFSLVESFLLIIVIVLIAFTGWYIYHTDHKTTATTLSTNTPKTSTNTTTTTNNAYAGWKTGTLQYEQINYMYPSNWTLSGSSMSASQQNAQTDMGYIFSPGEDNYTLQSPSGNNVQFITGAGGAFIPWQGSGTGIAIQSLGGQYYINFGEYNSGYLPPDFLPGQACLGTTDTSTEGLKEATIPSKYITYEDTSNNDATGSGTDGFCYNPKQQESVASYQSDPDFATAKLIFGSMKFE